MYRKVLLLSIYIILHVVVVRAQIKPCNSFDAMQQMISEDKNLASEKIKIENDISNWIRHNGSAKHTRNLIRIPVVVHVVYNTPQQNISDAQIYSQIDALNKDFQLLNTNSLPTTHPFYNNMANIGLEFVLAQLDPTGNPTTGITRTSTSVVGFSDVNINNIKTIATGGEAGWDPTRYLNIWVGNITTPSLLGSASFPLSLNNYPQYDGIVIRYQAFGTIGTAGQAPYYANDKGRTATHEIGHWLNLSHIWGDATCGNDNINDTPPAESENYGHPTFPHRAFNACGSGANGEMYSNFMDYTNDTVMNMFTQNQKNMMLGALSTVRSSIPSSNGIYFPLALQLLDFNVYTNANYDVQMHWQTNVDILGSQFEVERSTDNKNFERIATILYTINNTYYAYQDQNPVLGSNFYRLKIINVNGSISYSTVKSVYINTLHSNITLYPNIASDFLTIASVNKIVSVDIFSQDGKMVLHQINPSSIINTAALCNGMYIVVVNTEHETKKIKITVAH